MDIFKEKIQKRVTYEIKLALQSLKKSHLEDEVNHNS